MCGRVYGVSGEVCWHVGRRMGEVWGPNTLPHISSLTFPYISPYFPHTPTHFPTPPLIPLPTYPLPPPTPQHIFLLSPHLLSPVLPLEQWFSTFFLSWPNFCCTKVLWPIHFLSFLNEYSSPGAYPKSFDEGDVILN